MLCISMSNTILVMKEKKIYHTCGAPDFIHGIQRASCCSICSLTIVCFCVCCCPFTFDHCIVFTSSIYGFWFLLIWKWHKVFSYTITWFKIECPPRGTLILSYFPFDKENRTHSMQEQQIGRIIGESFSNNL
jgi:hypothetical protein